ncbi:hypothetical protein Ccar_01005 [Clostridium carboxidivorans P7]|uniref:DUF378 domain-containing protein n=1 Tax=Clostridium carboxidivorans P7 TaxID=536227 RepID=C6PQU8_9CLOT|nr:DUF378 domain-containing protein [Clostridium carboxidivorans]AKN29493.1 hypothetical protein Ccar_01005 [Clostridium carboxidivorans P7]EET88312.1 protein of unknown function DUF378 [Clostridium carboxidivorans P7]EFG89585.1 hypothetical protein CLCAR_0750 [Clostridium carboxidivorans P7]
MYKFSILDKISLVLVILGAVNWGLIGLSNINLIGLFLGEPADLIGRLIYILVGVSGLNILLILFRMKRTVNIRPINKRL